MPLFDTEYEVDRDPDQMSYQAIFRNGEGLMVSPHLCSNHEPEHSDHGHGDHRGYIDCTIITRAPQPNPLYSLGVGPPLLDVLVPVSWVMDLELASAMIEGLSEVAPWVQLNAETDLEAYDKEKNPRIDMDVETDHHDMEEE